MAIHTMRANLTESDIRTLVRGPTDEARAQAAHKICRCIDDMSMTQDERDYAEEILGIMAQDAAQLVRRALAVALKNSPKLPREIAAQLAADVDQIALPVIMNSPSLTDEDLVEIVRANPPSKQIAAASRETLPVSVTRALAEWGAPAAVERALANDNALFDEDGLQITLDRFSELGGITKAMAHRKVLPVTITEKLVSIVSGEVFDYLVNHHEIPPQTAIDIAMGARERATIDLIEQAVLQADIGRFIHQISVHGRLTPSLVMRALCMGHMDFVEHALAELAGLTHQRMWLMIHDNGPLGLKAAFERAGLPPRLFPPFRAAVDLYHQIERDGDIDDRATFRQRMIERVLTLFQSIPKDDLDYLLEKLDGVSERPLAIAV